jgi:hypothetical protein
MGAGVAVAADDRGPGEREPQFRADHVHDALAAALDVIERDPELAAVGPQGLDLPARERIADVELVPVLLDLSTAEDVQRRIDRLPAPQRLLQKALRLCAQAYQQRGLLSNCDLAELLQAPDSRIAGLLAQHERDTQTVVPRRATLHDVGTGLTHKRIICWKRYAEGKEPHVVARETYHSLEAVDRYLGQYDRVRHCRLQGLTPEQTAHALGCGLPLVKEYLAIDDLLEKRRP